MPPLRGPYTEHDRDPRAIVMLAYLAGITTRIRFATGVLFCCSARLRSLLGRRSIRPPLRQTAASRHLHRTFILWSVHVEDGAKP